MTLHVPHITVDTLCEIGPALSAAIVGEVARWGCVRISQSSDPAHYQLAMPALGRLFGRPMFHKLSDEFGIHPIRYIPGMGEYANANHDDLAPHTDGSFEQDPPAAMVIYTQQPSPQGGHSILASGDDLLDHIQQAGQDVLAGLLRPDAFRIRRDDREASRAVLEINGDRLKLAFRYADTLPITVHPDAQVGYGLVRDWVADPANRTELVLTVGEVLIFDNTRLLHGRTAYSSHAHERLLFGLWCDGEDAAAGARFGIPRRE